MNPSMAEIVIGVKQFHADFKKIAERARRGTSFLVVRHRTPLFRIEPPLPRTTRKKKYTLKDLEKIHFYTGNDTSLSKNIDRVIYGV